MAKTRKTKKYWKDVLKFIPPSNKETERETMQILDALVQDKDVDIFSVDMLSRRGMEELFQIVKGTSKEKTAYVIHLDWLWKLRDIAISMIDSRVTEDGLREVIFPVCDRIAFVEDCMLKWRELRSGKGKGIIDKQEKLSKENENIIANSKKVENLADQEQDHHFKYEQANQLHSSTNSTSKVQKKFELQEMPQNYTNEDSEWTDTTDWVTDNETDEEDDWVTDNETDEEDDWVTDNEEDLVTVTVTDDASDVENLVQVAITPHNLEYIMENMSEKSVVSNDNNAKTWTNVTDIMTDENENFNMEEVFEQPPSTLQQNRDEKITDHHGHIPNAGASQQVIQATINQFQLNKDTDYVNDTANKNIKNGHGCLENLDTTPIKCNVQKKFSS